MTLMKLPLNSLLGKGIAFALIHLINLSLTMVFLQTSFFSQLIKLFILLVILSSCNHSKHSRKEKERVNELLKEVLFHLDTTDSLAVEASKFIVENMSYQFSVRGTLVTAYEDSIKYHFDNALKMEQSLKMINQSARQYSLTFPDDTTYVSPEFLANNIKLALEKYRKSPWKESIPFDLFCKYVLPYKVNREQTENWREALLENKDFQVDKIIKNESMLGSATALHGAMYERKKDFKIINLGLPELPFSCTEALMVGTCHELCNYGVTVMRAFGIPTTVDFTPQFANRSGGHEWCSIIFSADSCQGFDVTVDSLGYNEFWDPETRFAKVYRRTYHQIESNHRSMMGFVSYLPNFFNDPRIEDVTHLYCETADIKIPRKKGESNSIIYLSVFDNKNWFPIAWGSTSDNSIVFQNLGREAVYLPEVFTEEKREPYDYPFVVNKNGDHQFLKPDLSELDTVRLTRKFPLTARIKLYISRMVGGRFQGSNHEDFRDAIDLYMIDTLDGVHYNEVKLNSNRKFRYVRYHSPSKGYCNVAELEFYEDLTTDRPLSGKVIGTDEVYQNDTSVAKSKVFDGKSLTYFDAKASEGAWVGLDLGSSKQIRKIRFLARNDLNGIYPKNEYELLYWDNSWVSLGRVIANKDVLIYPQVPKNALLLLRNLTEGKEERIFSYSDDSQVWW